jgi:sugar-specific transcriptional regulator TrmB
MLVVIIITKMNKEILTEIGLTKNESLIFLTLAERGEKTVVELAKLTGLNRPYIYYALERLIEKNFISKIIIDNKNKYQSQNFDQIIFSEEKKIELIKEISKKIKKINKNKQEETHLELLRGKNVIKTIFKRAMSELKSNEKVLSIGIDESKMEEIEPVYLKKIFNFCKSNNIKEKSIIKKNSKKLKYAKTTNYKFLDKTIIGSTAQIIYQDTVINIVYGNPLYAILIKSSEIADTEKRRFKIFWKHAKVM